MEFLIAQLMLYPEQNQDSTGHPNTKASDIDDGRDLIPEQMPECQFDGIFQHNGLPSDKVTEILRKNAQTLKPVPCNCLKTPFFLNQGQKDIFKIVM
jgi:hypothetical protein